MQTKIYNNLTRTPTSDDSVILLINYSFSLLINVLVPIL